MFIIIGWTKESIYEYCIRIWMQTDSFNENMCETHECTIALYKRVSTKHTSNTYWSMMQMNTWEVVLLNDDGKIEKVIIKKS